MCPPPAVHEGSESCTPLARAALGARLQWVETGSSSCRHGAGKPAAEEPGVGAVSPRVVTGSGWGWGQGAVVIVVGELGREAGESGVSRRWGGAGEG